MPELPEVETMVRGIRPAIENRTIERVEFCRCTRKPIAIAPSRRTFAGRIKGRLIQQVLRFAKRVVIELDSEDRIVVEPRMTGLMLLADPPSVEHRRICWHLQPAKQQPEPHFEFWDRRGLGTASLLNPEEFKSLQGRLGPDALQMTLELWAEQLSRTARPIKVALLDQKIVAGIGNLYASEILHTARIPPTKASDRLNKAERKRMAEATTEILETAIRYEGSTLGDGTYRNVLNKDGSYQNEHRVYAREDQPCPVCETPIRRTVQAQRSTFHCPKCQRT